MTARRPNAVRFAARTARRRGGVGRWAPKLAPWTTGAAWIGVATGFPALHAATNAVAAATGALPASSDLALTAVRMLGALSLVVALFLGAVWFFRNWQRVAARGGHPARLNVLEARALGQRQALYVVGYEQQRWLLASSPTGVTLLSQLPDVTEDPPAAAPLPTAGAFASALQQVLGRRT